MENIKDLRDEVLDIMARLKDGRTSATKAKEMANLAGKAINSAKIQIEYEVMRGTKGKISFLEEGRDDEEV
jgi:hypothetical protein